LHYSRIVAGPYFVPASIPKGVAHPSSRVALQLFSVQPLLEAGFQHPQDSVELAVAKPGGQQPATEVNNVRTAKGLNVAVGNHVFQYMFAQQGPTVIDVFRPDTLLFGPPGPPECSRWIAKARSSA